MLGWLAVLAELAGLSELAALAGWLTDWLAGWLGCAEKAEWLSCAGRPIGNWARYLGWSRYPG